ncbi:uncharacterized protein LOC131638009 [Vicia villosa]|uniref:uncharacterized protein LOC131638009 n=1 Tax=Vicia villosa TaxID=3911 RepID=UPI00273B96AA|nr:uncharacterized protein LOC131638009 [Vicia villosa]
MSKAYDRLEWGFISKVLSSMGFPEKFVNLIAQCLLKKGVADKKIHGVKIARNAPVISHLFFANDCLLFARANTSEARKILDILHQYQSALGQIVNFEKSEASFNSNVKLEDKVNIQNMMGVNTVQRHTKYLGIPIIFCRSKKDIFKLVVDRVQKKVKGWKEKALSKAEKEVLIKVVTQAIPNYIMGCYKIPESVCQEIESIVAKFWWGSKEGDQKIHWMRLERMAKSKKEEGSLFERVFKSRYYPNRSIQESKLGFNPSYAWRSILSSRELVLSGTRWCIGNGDKVVAKKDNWIPTVVYWGK